jgi:hypothetical protein
LTPTLLAGALPHALCERIGWLPHRKCYPLRLGRAGAADGETAQHGDAAGAHRSGTGAVRGAPRTERAKILDALVAGYRRKHAIRVLGAKDGKGIVKRRESRARYDEAVREAVIAPWE